MAISAKLPRPTFCLPCWASAKTPHKQRYLVTALSYEAKLCPGNMLVKVVQGVSTAIGRQMVDKEAYAPVIDAPALSHYTSLSLIDEIVGVNGKGLVPGGVKNRSQRSHVYFVGEQPPNDGTAPNQFWKDSTDCFVELNASAAQRHYECLQTDNGTILIGSAVSINFIARVILLGNARYTIWMNPNPKQMRGVTQKLCTCAKCGDRYVNGTQWCFRKCWVPLTWFAVQQRFMMIVDQNERDRELKAVYGLTRSQFSASPPALAGDSRGSNDPPALAGDPNGAGPASRMRRIQLCANIPNSKMKAWNVSAKRLKFLSHTDRYRRDPVYKAQMMRQNTPEWLVFSDGNTHRLDGEIGDQPFPM
jgi:hypothetical protein